MDNPIKSYWDFRLGDLKNSLEANNFEVYLAESSVQAKEIVLEKIIPEIDAKSISWGGSKTFVDSGLYDALKQEASLNVLDTFEKDVKSDEMLQRRREALLADLFITGTNAVTETGELVNLDMIGNRIAAITFGPRHVIILVGRNKIVPDVQEAMVRIKNYTAPVNIMRLEKKTPCLKSSVCEDCTSPERICNTWTITEKSFPKGRVKVVLINEDLGF